MAGWVVLVALAAVTAAGCSGDDTWRGCLGSGVVVTATIVVDAGASDAAASPDGGGVDAKPACTGNCREYLQALRVGIEGATPSTCELLTSSAALLCVPSSTTTGCPQDTVEEVQALEAQLRDYLAASWPEIGSSAVSLDTCVCNVD
jgi:hypothetical protein